MAALTSALRRYVQADVIRPTLGEAPRTSHLREEVLASDLMRISTVNRVYFALCFATTLAVLGGAGAIVVRYLESPETIGTIFVALGISVTGLIAQMVTLWKHKVLADTLLVLSRNLDSDQTKSVIDIILPKL